MNITSNWWNLPFKGIHKLIWLLSDICTSFLVGGKQEEECKHGNLINAQILKV